MLKKQTVWLLTMLSLMIVLSIYYMGSSNNEDLAYIDTGQESSEETATTDTTDGTLDDESDVEVGDIEEYGNDELFTTIRMELQNERSMKKGLLKDIVASSTSSTEEKNEALNDIDMIDQLATKESILQDSILASTDRYEDVLVRYDESKENEEKKVHVHVKVDELSSEEVVNIMQMVRDEFGDIKVDVNFQPTGS